MALSEKLKKMHAQQVAFAEQQFEAYKDWIVNEFVNEFGGSYQTAEGMKDVWRKTFEYAPECESFLEFKTRIFIRMLPDQENITNTPVFLKNFIRLVADYLSVYVSRKNSDIKHNDCANELFDRLYRAYANRVVKNYNKQKNLEWGLQQKAKREAQEAKQQSLTPVHEGKRKRIRPVRFTFKEEQLDKIKEQNVRARIRLKKQEIAELKISISALREQ